ncbi:hypothetical protein ACOSP7_010077 [Xanthoceras sorbifolium]
MVCYGLWFNRNLLVHQQQCRASGEVLPWVGLLSEFQNTQTALRVARNSGCGRNVVAAAARGFPGYFSVEVGEAIALREGLRLAIQLGLVVFWAEVDAASVATRVNSGCPSRRSGFSQSGNAQTKEKKDSGVQEESEQKGSGSHNVREEAGKKAVGAVMRNRVILGMMDGNVNEGFRVAVTVKVDYSNNAVKEEKVMVKSQLVESGSFCISSLDEASSNIQFVVVHGGDAQKQKKWKRRAREKG